MTKDPFRTRDHVPDFDAIVRDYAERSAATRARHRCVRDVAYGPGPDETLDLLLPPTHGVPAPVHVFVHGGYWRMFAKEDFSFVAETVLSEGAIAVVIDYSLMPRVRLEHIVDQVRRAVRWVAANIEGYGGDPMALSISGHSAGAHLCCWLLDAGFPDRSVRSALLLSGIYDLAPLQASFLHDLIGLTDEEVSRWSPLRANIGAGTHVTILVGERETRPFHEQAGRLADELAMRNVRQEFRVLAGDDHMTAVRALGDPQSQAAHELKRVIRTARLPAQTGS